MNVLEPRLPSALGTKPSMVGPGPGPLQPGSAEGCVGSRAGRGGLKIALCLGCFPSLSQNEAPVHIPVYTHSATQSPIGVTLGPSQTQKIAEESQET